jgi:hypothetical protein
MHKLIQNRFIFLLVLFSGISCIAFGQKADSTRAPTNLGAIVTLTNKGISSIPNLTLGKPAVIFYLSVGKKLRFEPEFRVALEGKPWMFIFWGRYDLLNTSKLFIKMRANASLAFNTISVTTDNVQNDVLKASRVLTADFATSYFVTKNITIGPYYMYNYGVEKNAIKNTHLISLRTSFSNINISDGVFIGINPQVYFLKMDKYNGFYFNSTLTLAKRTFPVSFSALINKAIHTEIPFGENFLWNVSLIYTFNKKYVEQK